MAVYKYDIKRNFGMMFSPAARILLTLLKLYLIILFSYDKLLAVRHCISEDRTGGQI
jgi:hypothetical protein